MPTYGEAWKCPECGNVNLASYYRTRKDNGMFRVRECEKCDLQCETFEKILKWRKKK
jgi:transcription elongation factor Elf1